MTGVKRARIRQCRFCQFNRFCSPWPWGKCNYAGETEAVDRDEAFMEGPDENCPAGYWAGLEPVDLEAERQEAQKRYLDRQREQFKPVVLERLRGREQTHIDDVLETLCALGALQPEIALEISDELEGKTAEA